MSGLTEAGASTTGPGSFDGLNEHRPRVLAWCRKFFPVEADAEDAAQETLLRAWEKREAFRGDCAYSTWLFKVSRTVCLNLLRERKGISLSFDDPDLPEAPSLDPGPDQLVYWRNLVEQVKSQLKECERLIFELTYALGMTSQECAFALPAHCGQSATGVRSVLARRIARVIESVKKTL